MKTITLTDEQWEILQSGEPITIEPPKPKHWKPQAGEWYVSATGVACPTNELLDPTKESARQHGLIYTRQEHAQMAAKAMRTFNRLLVYKTEHDPYYTFKFDRVNWFIHQTSSGSWIAANHTAMQNPTTVYMSKNVATRLAERLNSGEVQL
jgi:hypothetical protein